LVKHLLESDLTKRYGNLKGGANDVKGHRLFKSLDYSKLLQKQITPPYVPKIK